LSGSVAVQFLEHLPHFEGQRTGAQLFATVDLNRTRVGQTRVIDQDFGNPKWNESFHIYCAHDTSEVVFSVKAQMPIGLVEPAVGDAYIPVQDLIDSKGQLIDRWLELLGGEGRRPLPNVPKIHVQLRFTDVAADPQWGAGIDNAQYKGVPRTFFKQRQGCRVTLYQDAHVLDTFKPSIQLDGDRPYEQHRCWEDIYDAISDAHHVVYISGWAVYAELTLVRDGSRHPTGGGTTLGELLKRKAKDGVHVLMLVWDDPSTPLNLGLFPGLVGTKDYNTFRYFRGSGVHCVPCPRNHDAVDNVVQGLKAWGYSHHQKSVIVDVEDGALRRIVSFVGGLDLTNGRYDTQEHSLFRTLKAAHSQDFYQGNIPPASPAMGGPREPWHDIHCKIEGPAAWDVLHNFEQRWRKQGGKDDFIHNVLWPWRNQKEVLVDLKGMEDVIAPQSTPVVPSSDQEAWNVQVFRSTDSSACSDFPQTPAEAAQSGIVSGRDHLIDRSIQDAYINAIRRAKNFIYIENQYFIGSSFGWKPDGITPEDIGALHLIPKELSLKIVSKIKAGKPFSVYIVVPMWPEGDPSDFKTQAMLHWQRKTIEMMYYDIATALKVNNINADPKDYLSFFCLGNREEKLQSEIDPKEHPPRGSDYDRAQKARRAMIYVHSKLMIVDDEYIIIGSANINQRSMDGGRDTEIAMGAYQPFHLNTNGQGGRGQVHGLRMSLWFEHLATLKDEFKEPGNKNCIQMVNKMANDFWQLYTSDMVSELHGHLLSYPIDVTGDGTVTELKGMKFFPDTNAPVLGSLSGWVNIGAKITDYTITT
ncbi:Phospholipase D alpha 2, partial [Dichanthelium oligosanthes]